jgi:hypothetical protein
MKTLVLDDGSRLVWKDRETLCYEDAGRLALIWVDYEPGFFSRGRVIHMSSLERWHQTPQGADEAISDEKKGQIIAKVRQYFGNRPVRVVQDG